MLHAMHVVLNLATLMWCSNPLSNVELNRLSSVSLYHVYKSLHAQICKYLQATDESVEMFASVF